MKTDPTGIPEPSVLERHGCLFKLVLLGMLVIWPWLVVRRLWTRRHLARLVAECGDEPLTLPGPSDVVSGRCTVFQDHLGGFHPTEERWALELEDTTGRRIVLVEEQPGRVMALAEELHALGRSGAPTYVDASPLGDVADMFIGALWFAGLFVLALYLLR